MLPIAIIAIVFSFVLLIVKMSQNHELEKQRISKGSDKSLTVTELNEIVATAVEDAIAPLKDRIHQLEAGNVQPLEGGNVQPNDEQKQLEAASRRLDLDDIDQDLTEDSTEKVVSSRKKVH